MGSMSIWHWVIVGAIVLLLFGRGKVSELMGDVAKGIKAFKKGMSEEEEVKAADANAKPVTDQSVVPGTATAAPAAKSDQKAG